MSLSNTHSPANPEADLNRFFAMTFIISWLFWLPRVLTDAGVIALPAVLDWVLNILAWLSPSAVAFWLTWRSEGRTAVRTLWLRGWSLKFDLRWLLPAILLMPLIVGGTALALLLMGMDIPKELGVAPAMMVPLFLLMYLIAIGAEFGWRGYALKRMQARRTPLQASLILGLAWGLWHLPLHYITASPFSQIPMWQFFLQTTALSVLYTWLYNKTGASVLIVILFSAFSAFSAAILPIWQSSNGRWILLLLTVAAIFGMAFFTGLRKYKRS